VSHDAVLSALALDGGEAADRGHALYFVACVTMELARPSETYAHLASAEASFAAADDLGGLSMVENLRCFQSVMLGEAQRACAEGVRAVELARAAGSADLEMPATQHLALALCLAARESPTPDRARLEEARRLLEASREWLLDQGRDSAVADANLAVVLSELGAYEEALGHAQRALLLERERGTRRIAEALITIALSASGLERHRDAIRLLRVAERRLDDQGTARHDWIEESAARIAACARAALGDRGYEAACRQGAELSLDDAFELALATETRRAAARRSTAAQRTGPGR
jgi:tetratricopeptide (TPR) repeat protein